MAADWIAEWTTDWTTDWTPTHWPPQVTNRCPQCRAAFSLIRPQGGEAADWTTDWTADWVADRTTEWASTGDEPMPPVPHRILSDPPPG